jgi:hypothetical protein
MDPESHEEAGTPTEASPEVIVLANAIHDIADALREVSSSIHALAQAHMTDDSGMGSNPQTLS